MQRYESPLYLNPFPSSTLALLHGVENGGAKIGAKRGWEKKKYYFRLTSLLSSPLRLDKSSIMI
jgi:hypothetical protein